MSDITLVIAGEAGQGLVTIGSILTRALVRGGFEVLVQQDYMSRIRGGLNSWRIRFGPEEIDAPKEAIDILVAFSQDAVDRFSPHLTDRGLLIVDAPLAPEGLPTLAIPMKDLAPKSLHNTLALGVAAASICGNLLTVERILTETLASLPPETLQANIEALRKASIWAQENSRRFVCTLPGHMGPGNLTLNGNEAIALGAMAAGCRFASFYPMTPGTSVIQALITHGGELGLFVEQVEDEIAAINMAIGASFAGARAMTATSGGGFALMTEGVSLAGITETPLVIILVQRPGPATGLPTRTEQADLDLARFAGHGEFPRAILTPGTPEECFHLTHWAFHLAEASQGPVLLLSDQYLADSYRNVTPFDLDNLPAILGPEISGTSPYERYAWNPSTGVSPRRVPGATSALVVADSDEHTPDGHITEDHDIRVRMQDKRMRKETLLSDLALPPIFTGTEKADLLLVCWGSSLGACLEAMDLLKKRTLSVAVLHFRQTWPLNPESFRHHVEAAARVVVVEGNHTGQFARLLSETLGIPKLPVISRYDGLPFTARFILDRLDPFPSEVA